VSGKQIEPEFLVTHFRFEAGHDPPTRADGWKLALSAGGDSMNHFSDNVNLIWDIADTLRGPYRPPEYRRVILPMTVLRRLECVREPTKEQVLETQKKWNRSPIRTWGYGKCPAQRGHPRIFRPRGKAPRARGLDRRRQNESRSRNPVHAALLQVRTATPQTPRIPRRPPLRRRHGPTRHP